MANISKQRLAQRLLQNWLSKNPLDSNNTGVCNIDDGLQSLGWLMNARVGHTMDTKTVYSKNNVSCSAYNYDHSRQSVIRSPVIHPDVDTDSTDNKENIKPSYSYATLITAAIYGTAEKKMNISAIYEWISDHFPFYKMADNQWKNSIRHNLSLNKRFEKIPRRPNEPGKGGFWRITPVSNDGIRDNSTVKRSLVSINPAAKRVKIDNDAPVVTNGCKSYFVGQDTTTEPMCNNNFNWSAALPRDIYVDGVNIKVETMFDDADYGNTPSPFSSSDVEDDVSLSSFSTARSCDVSSDDLSCFDDLCVFNFTGNPRNQQLDDRPLDLSTTINGSDDHGWWQQSVDLNNLMY